MTQRDDAMPEPYEPYELPVSAGALLFDSQGRLLVLRPTYKSGWTIPGGGMEATGESPWDACRREVFEETGLRVNAGRLVAVDTRPGKHDGKLGLRFLFDCGAVSVRDAEHISVQAEEIAEYRFVERIDAMALLRKPIRRRVAHGWGTTTTVYLENGRPVPGVTVR